MKISIGKILWALLLVLVLFLARPVGFLRSTESKEIKLNSVFYAYAHEEFSEKFIFLIA